MNEFIPLEGVSVSSLRLLAEDVLVRPAPAEEVRASGLFIPNAPSQHLLGGTFYGVVVAVGPGRLVEKAPSANEVVQIIEDELEPRVGCTLSTNAIKAVERVVRSLLAARQEGKYVPTPWKPGDHVLCRQGFGPEVELREGRHHIVGRGNSEYGHGVIAAWDASHIHCWHYRMNKLGYDEAVCACGAVNPTLETRLPACSSCPPGERLAEAVLGGVVADVPIPSDAGAGAYEMRPVDDGRNNV